MAVSEQLIEHVKRFEGRHGWDDRAGVFRPYLCPAGIVTIGWGEVLNDPQTRQPLRGMDALRRCTATRTEVEADAFLASRLSKDRARLVGNYPWLNPHEADALTAMAYNTGLAPMLDQKFGLARALQERRKFDVPVEMRRWDKARVDGVLTALPGLVRRRAEEAAWFSGPVAQAMPQQVEPPPPSATKPTAGEAGAAATIAAGAASVLAPLGQARDFLVSLGLDPGTVGLVLGVAVLGLGAFWLYRARRARLTG